MGEVTSKPGAPEAKDDTVATESAAYKEMSPHWDLIHALQSGTQGMRDAGDTWLPQEPSERADAYEVRLGRSFLHPAYQSAVQTITSKPFIRPVTVQGKMPENLEELAEDVTASGENLSQFARRLFDILVNYGVAHILVDYPQVVNPDETTKADERAMGARPQFLAISPVDLHGFVIDTETMKGTPRLTQIRYREVRTKSAGTYADKSVTYIRVYNHDTWELHEEQTDATGRITYKQIDEGKHTFGRIPLVTCYVNRTGFMTALPPLEELAWLNLAHWQSMSDQRNILRFARVALLFGSGFTQKELDDGLTIGADRLLGSTNPNAKLSFVEHTGAAIGAGQVDLDKLEERMEILGLQPFVQRSGGATATGRAIDEGKRQSDVQAWIRSLENILADAYRLAAEWLKAELPEDFKVDVFNDFGLTIKASTDIEALIKVRQAGQISHPTFLREIKRRGLLSETVDVETEVAAIEAEGPALAGIGMGGGGTEEDDEEE